KDLFALGLALFGVVGARLALLRLLFEFVQQSHAPCPYASHSFKAGQCAAFPCDDRIPRLCGAAAAAKLDRAAPARKGLLPRHPTRSRGRRATACMSTPLAGRLFIFGRSNAMLLAQFR